LIFSLITLLFGIVDGVISVLFGAALFLTKAYFSSISYERYIFYSIVSMISVVTIGLLVTYERKIIKRLKNKIVTLQEAPLEFNLKPGGRNDPVQYSEIISDDGLKKEKNRLMVMLNERLFNIVETIRSTIHPYTVILYLIDNDMKLRGREILSNSEWIDMDKPLSSDDPYIGWILKNKKSMLLNEIKDEIKGIPYYTRNEGIKSFMAVPALRENDIVGIICVDSLEVQAFTDEHTKLLTVISNQIIDLMDNIELQYKLRYDMYEKGAMYTFVRTLSHYIDASDIARASLSEIIRITNASAGIFATKNEHNNFDVVFTQNIDKDIVGKDLFLDTEPTHDGILENQLSVTSQVTTAQIKFLYPALYNLYVPDKTLKYTVIISLRGKMEEVGLIVLFMENTINERISIILDTLINQVSISLYNSILFDKLGKLAITDGLTNLHNHRHFQEYLEAEIKEASRYNKPLTLLMIDIDHFKILNDTYGHPQGDRVLKKLSEIIMQTIRDVDFAARYGGEEFCIVLPNTDAKGANKTAERLRKNIEALTIKTDTGKNIKFTISIGISSLPEDARGKDELILHADKSLYLSKENGRNKTTIYDTIKQRSNEP
jgi:diguanylate cyclase (GGDEF)-like protein